jgi:hypothetical protein
MPTTWADFLSVEPDEAWRQLRLLRHKPPGAAASSDERRQTFNAALEQAEQLFAAARAMGTATRRLLLFYGLSQAGRALAACSSMLASDSWMLRGHGLKFVAGNSLADSTSVKDRGMGAYIQVGRAVAGECLAGPTKMPILWSLLPELGAVPLDNSVVIPGVIGLRWVPRMPGDDTQSLAVLGPIPEELLPNTAAPPPWDYTVIESSVRNFMQHYPTMNAYLLDMGPGLPVLLEQQGGQRSITMRWVHEGRSRPRTFVDGQRERI